MPDPIPTDPAHRLVGRAVAAARSSGGAATDRRAGPLTPSRGRRPVRPSGRTCPGADLHRWAADTWHSLDAMTDPGTGLPADNIPESLAAEDRSGYTSPTNIGGYLWSTVVARELGIISRRECTRPARPAR